MRQVNPYQIIKRRYMTEKSSVLEGLKNATSNASVRKCQNSKYVFEVHPKANKREIAMALEEIYREKNIKVVSINTIIVKPKRLNPRGKMRPGRTTLVKKAIATFAVGDSLDD